MFLSDEPNSGRIFYFRVRMFPNLFPEGFILDPPYLWPYPLDFSLHFDSHLIVNW